MGKHCVFVTLLVLVFVSFSQSRGRNEVLSRKRRYITFPEGSSVSIAVCMTAQTGVIPPGIFTESIAWGLAYELPDNATDYRELYSASKYLLKRRHRRDLYGKMETIMNSMGYDGRSCILRSLCEAAYRFLPKEDNLLHYILSIIFGMVQELYDIKRYNENVLLAYIFRGYEKSILLHQCGDTTQWLKQPFLSAKNDINISKYKKLTAFLKQEGRNHDPKSPIPFYKKKHSIFY